VLSCLVLLALAGLAKHSRAQWPLPRGASGTAQVEVLDVGQGDSILIRSPEGKTALIDAGPTRMGALRTLRREGISAIDLVVLSHHHADHYGGMEEVVSALRPRYFLASHSRHSTKPFLKLLETIEREGITSIQPGPRPRRIELGSVELTILPQPPEDPREENNNSVGLRLKFGAFRVLLPGDSEGPERSWWLKHHPELVGDCMILKLAHHGSRNGTDREWLQAVRPQLALASLGAGNEYGHPHLETLRLLRQADVPLLRTDQLGTITIQSDGHDFSVVRPLFPPRRRPTQQEVDRVAARPSATPASRPVTQSLTR
jgi:beta-lactamase superfamily II metal-dependent hydrolase